MALINDRNRKWWTVGAMALTVITVSVNFSGLTVALPAIRQALGASTVALQWMVTAYLLAFAAPTVAAGRLGDIFGRRRVLLIGTSVFGVASVICGLAQTDSWLIAARVVQGLGASALFAPPCQSSATPSRPTSGAGVSGPGRASARWGRPPGR